MGLEYCNVPPKEQIREASLTIAENIDATKDGLVCVNSCIGEFDGVNHQEIFEYYFNKYSQKKKIDFYHYEDDPRVVNDYLGDSPYSHVWIFLLHKPTPRIEAYLESNHNIIREHVFVAARVHFHLR